MDYFEVLSVPKRFSQDLKALEKRFYELSRALHPDRFQASGDRELQKQALEKMSLLNQAYTTLKNPDLRRAYILSLQEGPSQASPSAKKSGIPMDLAEEWFEIQDLRMDDPAAAGPRIQAFTGTIRTQISECNDRLRRLEDQYDQGHESVLAEIRETLNRRTTLESLLKDVLQS
ncbi:MAG: Fe-S protein assembly co-chaperone HscB [Bdellovibrionales bacterium]|nr:Fe-S protein assembly co-chaperone HscB [Bdellovibrionales bacterium]